MTLKKRINLLMALAVLAATSSYSLFAQNDANKAQKAKQERPTYPFDRKWLENKAKELASQEYQLQRIPEDNPLSKMSYDEYKKIQFERGATIWSREDRNFRLAPLHPGFLFKTPVKLNLVVGGVSRRVLYTTDIFNYNDELQDIKKSEAKGYSGFSVTHPINNAKKWDEFMVFQGGTYFRAVGESNWYGLSARGLAINTAKPSGEEFPEFTEFWIERPSKKNQYLTVHALMRSPSATGAFTFTASPGKNTEIKVESVLFPRKDIPSFGIAPLTSMFLFNPIDTTRFDDFRPAVHDSDGLFMIKNNGEKIWRPLANPRRLEVSVFEDDEIKGFGLMQRSRKFTNFEDIEAHYQKRPSAWVTPISNWGKGHVELIEIPTNAEIHDNIVAFWQPTEPLKAGEKHSFSYKVSWGSSVPEELHDGRIVATASGRALASNTVRDFVIDYEGKSIPSDMIINASSSTGKIVGTISKVIPENGNLRVVVKFEAGEENFSELRVSLTNKDKQWGETWLYRWTR
jgi:glucans biosynthesis protein